MQWANLPELHQTPTLDDSDLNCLEEIRGVLSRHGKLARFAVHLAHRHFDLGPGEIRIEQPDPDARTQHVTVGRLDDEPEARPTTWLFEEGPELRLSDTVYCVCVSDLNKTEACISKYAVAADAAIVNPSGALPGAPPLRAGAKSLIFNRSSSLINPLRALYSLPVHASGKSSGPRRFTAARTEI